jgi:hypothetical protein
VRPSATTSGTEPARSATTGVPQAIASTITIPNGSSHWMGKTRQLALASSFFFSSVLACPNHSASGPSSGATRSLK